ncbi:MAG: EAL domain-containing protein [Campylobacterota bacterium]|nr:EAL domain-containing protein [Campylobacterota bacterium]
MKINFNSITLRTVLHIFTFSVLFILFIIFVIRNIFATAYMDLEKEKIFIIQNNIVPSLSLNLSYGFHEAVNEIANQTLLNKDVLLIKILNYENNNTQLFSNYQHSLEKYKKDGELFSYTKLSDPAMQKDIADLTIIYSNDSYEEYVSNFNTWLFWGVLGFSLSIAFLSFLLYNSLKNLTILDSSLKSFNPNEPKLLELDTSKNDEVSSISLSANIMIKNIIKFLDSLKSLNEKLLQSQVHLKEAQRIANVGSWEYLVNEDKLLLSDEIYRILNMKRDRTLTWSEFQSLICKKDREYIYGVLKDALVKGGRFDIQHCIKLQNKKSLQVHTKGKVRKKANGSVKMTAVSMDITQDTQNKKMIEKLAYYDALTGLPNRVLLKDRIHKAIQNADRLKSKIALIFLDLDHFKLINDTLGHDTGDKLLIYVSALLKKQLRESDTLSRLGGDEFVILLPNITSVEAAKNIANKLVSAFNGQHNIETHQLYITTSIGISLYPDNSDSLDSLIMNADTAMYDAKQDGRNQYKIYSKDMGNYISTQMRVEQDFKLAIDNHNEFEVYYQPKINSVNGEISGAEALIRWNHPTKGLVFPDDFINIAESTGMILDLGKWIIQECMIQIQKWEKVNIIGLKVAINLSAKQFQDSNLVSFIIAMIEQYDIDPAQLEFEVTETVSMANMDATLRVLNELKIIGVNIAIDDFGTGYSSLSYLKKFPINTLKIDKSFVLDMIHDNEDKIIVQTIISMAHSLGFTTVAEGVETKAHVDALIDMKCDYLQGYYYSRPIPKNEFTQLLQNYTPLT